MKKLSVVFLGPPGVGKGTQSKIVSEYFGIPHISTGDMLRAERKAGTSLGKQVQDILGRGDLVPDDLVVAIVEKRLAEPDCEGGYILDGFPRTVAQADELEAMSATALVYNLTADAEALVARIAKRRSCPKCGQMISVEAVGDNVGCPRCGTDMVQREDDCEGTVRNRLRVYNEQTAPLIAYYREMNLLKSVDGMRNIDVITGEVIADMEQYRGR